MKDLARCSRRGFTLGELLVSLLIGAVLLAIATPNLHALIVRQQLRTTANDLFAAIDLTRSQAITRGARVLLMPAGADGVDWSRGWVVFVDKNGSRSLDPDDELIFQQGPVPAGLTIRAAFTSPLPPSYLAYNGAGRSCSASNSMAARWGTLSLLLDGQARHIKINMLGRVRICDPAAPGQGATCSGAAEE